MSVSYGDLVPAPRSVRLAEPPTPPPTPPPAPQQGGGRAEFVLGPATALDAGPGTHGTATWLRGTLTPAMGLPLLPPGRADGEGDDDGYGDEDGAGVLTLRTDGEIADRLGPEGYVLQAAPGALRIIGGAPAGVFWGAQTLRQLLGPAAYRRANTAPASASASYGAHRIPAVRIEDGPRFEWRGYLLDVARHFTPKDGVLRTLDLLAAHKLNVLHLHLTDDQGWRIEIRGWPRLTEVGAARRRSRVGHRASPLWDERTHGGRYTQEDLREIVAYAADRHITVVPEIDVPGHSQAAIAAYPELGNTDVVDTSALEVWTDWGVSPNVLATGDHVLRFYESVLEEVLEIFPSRFVHLGGDECPKDQWRASPAARARMRELGPDGPRGAPRREDPAEALQAWFVQHFDRWLAARGRRLVGWDEILDGGPALSEGAVVSSWRGREGAVAAARAGHDVVLCPEQQVYLDHRQDGGPGEPVPLGYVRTLRDVHGFEPVPEELAGTPHERHVLGAQANMWTECAESQQRVDYQTFPRLAAFAEAVWSPRPGPGRSGPGGAHGSRGSEDFGDFGDFERRMTGAHYARLEAMGVDFRPPGGPHPWQRREGIAGRPRDEPCDEPSNGPGEEGDGAAGEKAADGTA